MMALAIEGFFPSLADRFSHSGFWQFLGRQFSHVAWQGCSFWDVIQPSFMFIVGVALPYSYAARRAAGASGATIAAHVVYRAAILVLLGILILSDNSSQTNFEFIDVLAQIGLAYPLAFLLVGRRPRVQLAAAAAILGGYWLAFYLSPLPPAGFDYASVGVAPGGEPYHGLFAHWNKNTNFAAGFDRWFLNLFPRAEPYHYNWKGLQTLSFVPSIVTLLGGIMAGELLRSGLAPKDKLRRLGAGGLACLALGLAFAATACPLVKTIWTPSWVLFSTGLTLWLLVAFYAVIDLAGWRRAAFPLVVVGMNPIAMYCMIRLFKSWLWKTIGTHFGGLSWSLHFLSVTAILWLICWWMYRRRLFIRI